MNFVALETILEDKFFKSADFNCVTIIVNDFMLLKVTKMSDKSELKAELERKKQRLAQIREEKKRKEEERKKKEVCLILKNKQHKIIGFYFK